MEPHASQEYSYVSRLENISLALRTLHEEIFGFRFHYPLALDESAGPRNSLHYYLYGKSLPWTSMRLDPAGIPKEWERVTGVVYRPNYIACYGLTNLGHYLRTRKQSFLDTFLKQVQWLEKNAVVREDGAAVWYNNFDYREGDVLLKAPWLSANTTGFVLSALVRGFRVTRRPSLIGLLKRSTKIFHLDWNRGGIRLPIDGCFLYTEKPGLPAPGILDGFLRSLLGLYDVAIELDDQDSYDLFQQGVIGLKHTLNAWDYKERWSWYGNKDYLCPPQYHVLNRLLLLVLARLASEPVLAEIANRWDPEELSMSQRFDIYLRFQMTKNRCRIRNKTWRHRTLSDDNPRLNASVIADGATGAVTVEASTPPSQPVFMA